jgi:hypothetical protein
VSNPDAPQPPPLECQFCGVDLAKAPHKMTCRVVVDIGGIPGWLDMPAHLQRKRMAGSVPHTASVEDD